MSLTGQAMSGSHIENDGVLMQQLENLLEAFFFLYGSFELEKTV
jgi:hypothetical protein